MNTKRVIILLIILSLIALVIDVTTVEVESLSSEEQDKLLQSYRERDARTEDELTNELLYKSKSSIQHLDKMITYLHTAFYIPYYYDIVKRPSLRNQEGKLNLGVREKMKMKEEVIFKKIIHVLEWEKEDGVWDLVSVNCKYPSTELFREDIVSIYHANKFINVDYYIEYYLERIERYRTYKFNLNLKYDIIDGLPNLRIRAKDDDILSFRNNEHLLTGMLNYSKPFPEFEDRYFLPDLEGAMKYLENKDEEDIKYKDLHIRYKHKL